MTLNLSVPKKGKLARGDLAKGTKAEILMQGKAQNQSCATQVWLEDTRDREAKMNHRGWDGERKRTQRQKVNTVKKVVSGHSKHTFIFLAEIWG